MTDTRFPEGFTLAVAAVFGAVIVLAAFLGLRQLLDDDGAEVAAESPPPTSVAAGGGSGVDESDSSAGSSGFGDLPSSAAEGEDDGEDDEDSAAADEDDQGEEEDPPTPDDQPDVEPVSCPEGVLPVICDAAEFVQTERGRPFQTFPNVEILEDAEFDAALLDDFEQYRDDFDVDDVTLTALGLLDPEISMADAFRDLLEVGVVGFYDPEDGRLVVRGADFNLYGQLVLVHELVHAYDDQWFDLDRDDLGDDDAEYGFSAVVEGNASRVEDAWRAALSAEDRSTLAAEELGALSPEDIQRFLALPQIMAQLQASPYVDGQVYVEDLADSGGEAAVDEALTNPPLTSEEILHPGTDRAVDPELVLPTPPAGGEVVGEGRLGELLIRLWLGNGAAEGWGGDRYVTWIADGQDCIAVDLAGDTAAETDELTTAAESWAALAPDDRSVEPVTSGGRAATRVTGCA